MKAKDFLNALVADLAGSLRLQTLQELKDYYQEQIDDRVEEGASEEEAVAALGDVRALAAEILSEVDHQSERVVSGTVSEAGHEAMMGQVDRIVMKMNRVDVEIVVGALQAGEGARIYTNAAYEANLSDGCLTVEELQQEGNFITRLLARRMRIELGSESLEAVDITAFAADVRLNGLTVKGKISIETRAGDVLFENTSADGLSLRTVSGDMSLEGVQGRTIEVNSASGDLAGASIRAWEMRFKTASGDIFIDDARVGGSVEMKSASGDIHLGNGASASAALETSSGDVSVEDWRVGEALSAATSVGDVALHRTVGNMELRTKAGDISGELLDVGSGYRFLAQSRRGDVHVPNSDGAFCVRAEALSGDIRLSVREA